MNAYVGNNATRQENGMQEREEMWVLEMKRRMYGYL